MNNPKNVLSESKTPLEKINTLLCISDSLFTSYPEQSLKYAQHALQLSEKENYEKGQFPNKVN